MIEERLFALMDPVLRSSGAVAEAGEDHHAPPLQVLRYYRRPVRWSPFPFLGRGLSLVAVVRAPAELERGERGLKPLLERLARVVGTRFPPWKGAVLGLTAVVLTAEPVGPADEAALTRALEVSLRRYRVVSFGIIKLNLGEETVAWALKSSPDQLFPEPVQLADALGQHFRRFVPLIEM